MPEIIISLGSLLISSGALGYILFYDSKRRKEQAGAVRAEADNDIMISKEWKEVAEKREKQMDVKDAKIEELYISINQWRDRHNELAAENHALKLQQITDTYKICNRRLCDQREPQTGY